MPTQESSVGPVVATIVILAVIVLGGLYFWSHRSAGSANSYATPTTSSDASSVVSSSTPTNTNGNTYDVNSPMSGS
jgi:uncharacterized protein YxeA